MPSGRATAIVDLTRSQRHLAGATPAAATAENHLRSRAEVRHTERASDRRSCRQPA